MTPPGKPPAASSKPDLQMNAPLHEIRDGSARAAGNDQYERRPGRFGRCEPEEQSQRGHQNEAAAEPDHRAERA